MPGISRVKTWIGREVLVYSDLNDEFDNIINNLEASNVDGYSASVAQMRETTDPGGIGTESLALRISDELKRIRFALSRIVGKTYWYEAPSRSLQTLYSDADLYFQVSPYLGTLDINEAISETILAGYYDSDGFNDSNWLDTTNKKMSDTAFALKNDVADSRYFIVNTSKTSSRSGTISLWFRNFASNDTIFLNPLSGLRVYLNANGFLKLDQEVQTAATASTKVVQSITGTSSLSGSTSFNNVIIRYKYGNTASDKVDLLLNGVLVGSISGSALPVNVPGAPNNKSVLFGNRSSYSKTYGTPFTFPQSWTPTSTDFTAIITGAGSLSATDGILTITGSATTDTAYIVNTTATNPLDSLPTNGQSVELKFKLGANVATAVAATDVPNIGAPFEIALHNNGAGKGIFVRVLHDEIYFNRSSGLGINTSDPPLLTIAHNFTDWTHLYVVMKSATTFVFINGELKGSFSTPTDGTANNRVAFGKIQSASTVLSEVSVEYFIVGNNLSANPDYFQENISNVQQISDPCFIRGFITDSATISSLQNSSPFSLFGKSARTSNTVSNRTFGIGVSVPTTQVLSVGAIADFYSDGINPVKINANFSCRPSAAGAGTYKIGGYLTVARSYDLTAQHIQNLVTSTTSTISAASNLSHAVNFVVPAATEPQWELPIFTAMLLPAGKYTLTGFVFNQNSAGTIVVNRAKCYVSN